MKTMFHVLAALCSANTISGRRPVKTIARIMAGAGILVIAYLMAAGLRGPMLPHQAGAPARWRPTTSSAFKVGDFPSLRSALSLPKVHAQPGCSTSTLNGTYSGYAWGSASGTPENSVSIWSFNGSGSVTLDYWSMSGGNYSSGSNTYNYSVNSPTCEGTLYSGSTTYDTFTIANNGGEILMSNDVSGWDLVNDAKLQTEACSSLANDTFAGYSWGSSSGVQNYGVSIYTFASSGVVTGSYWSSYGGSPRQGTFNYTYTLNSNCQGTINLGSTLIAVFTMVPGTPAELFVLDAVPSSNIVNDLKQY